MPKIRQLNTLRNYNSLFRSMIKDQKRKNNPNHSTNRLTQKTRRTYEELKRLEILKKVQNHRSRMGSRQGTKF